ncbi:MAG: PAS domain S-box protein [Planctomycetes bacterium]|nr:PAS domain S-box protein [Planctomycetota bacterium]
MNDSVLPPADGNGSRNTFVAFVAISLVSVIFVTDLLVPVGYACELLYVVPLLLCSWQSSRRCTISIGVTSVVLTIAASFFEPRTSDLAVAITNRALSTVTIVATTAAILARHRAAARLVAERERRREYLDIANVAIVALDSDARVTLINRKGCEVIGYEARDVVGKDWFDTVIPERVRADARAVFDRLIAGEIVPKSDYPIRTRTGDQRTIAWHNAVLRDSQGRINGTLSSGEDVTERENAERELNRTLRQLEDFKYALDQSAIVATTDRKGLITYANDKFCQISKYSRDELIGKDHRILNSGLHPKEFMHNLWRTITAGKVWRGEIRNRAKDGQYYWVDTTIVPFLSADGTPYQYLAIRADITERKRAQEALLEQESLAKLGQMAAVVAHEVKNPLAGIAGVMQVLQDRFPEGSTEREMMAAVLARIDALSGMIEDLLVFARPRTPKPTAFDLLPLLREATSLLSEDPQLKDVAVELPAGVPPLSGDAELLQPVFLNLFLNAAQAMRGKGVIRVSCAASNGTCRIAVSDEGPGISPEIRAKIFEPFFTTKHRGTGLGLAIAKRVIGAHGGDISAECPPGGGTTMLVTLPLARH